MTHAFLLLLMALGDTATPLQQTPAPPPAPEERRLRVFLDCESCYADYLREEIRFVDFVRDRTEAGAHLLITRSGTGSGGQEYTAQFVGLGPLAGVEHTLKAFTTTGDTDDTIRRQLANTVRLGLLQLLSRDGVPQALDLRVGLAEGRRTTSGTDRWKLWVFSVRGSASIQGEESQRQLELGGAVGADRITPDWKITLGLDVEHERERFNINEEDEEPFEVERRERDFNWLVVNGLGEHWSVGATGDIESSTFENTSLAVQLAPAIEYNLFPYSQYTRRQLRVLYSLGPRVVDYYEETLFGKTEETLVQHALSATYDQRERWGSLEARVEWSQYLHDTSLSRLDADGEISLRVARGLSLTAEMNASRIRDQLSLPRRGATPEEILLELRELRSGYEYEFSFGLTYTFGSIFSSVVNPRFGQ